MHESIEKRVPRAKLNRKTKIFVTKSGFMKRRSKISHHPLLCWDIASQALYRSKNFYDITEFEKAYRRFKWNFELPSMKERIFDSIVLTDINERIVWTSPGFKSMTGYSQTFAIGKKPNFLQGKNTDENVKNKIRSAIDQRMPVEGTLVNYRRNGTPYHCYVNIIPLLSPSGDLENFVAFEQEVNTL